MKGLLYEDRDYLCICITCFRVISADTVVATKMGDDLDQIDDVGEIAEIMKSLHIPTIGLTGCEAMKNKLRDFLEESATKRVSEVSAIFFF